MFTKLWARFALIIAIVLLCWGILSVYPLKPGIDLAGGIDLIYELDYSKLSTTDRAGTANKVIDTLKERVDPTGVKNLTWRAISGGNRIEIQMPLAGKDTQEARKAYREAEQALADLNLRLPEINTALQRDAAKRSADFDKMAAPGTPRRALLEQLAQAYDARQKLSAQIAQYVSADKIPAESLDALDAARKAYDTALGNVLGTNVDMATLNELLEAAESPKGQAARDALDELPKKHPHQTKEIAALREAYTKLQEHRGAGFDDPADLERLLKGKGELDFRIAVEPGDPAARPGINQALEQLQNVGPVKAQGPNMKWFEVDAKNGAQLLGDSRLVIAPWGSGHYVLLYTDPGHALTHDPEHYESWSLTDRNRVGRDTETGGVDVEFEFDARGANYFGLLTSNNEKTHPPMAILLDDKALSAPNIHTAITGGSGRITFGSSLGRPADAVMKEADTLVRMLNAGSLPAALSPEPVSVQTIGSELGQDNINAGFRSGVYAIIAVMAFMVVYYTLTGSFANLAVMINLLMTLSAMAVFGATFTLPGIAGIVLTLGMAVDANVLINERIREEIHRGASLWLAVRQGYDKVFWTIFDANTTTSLTSIVLIAVASEEVKGFGVTLLIGLLVHMFTALFVTRTLMIAGIKWGIMRHIDDHSIAEYIREIFTFTWLRQGRWPFMRVITVSNIDWIGKRHIFWAISAVITIAGLVAFFARGSDKYDTEFNGGTQLTFRLNKATDIEVLRDEINNQISRELKEDANKATGEKAAQLDKISRDIQQAHIVPIGDPKQATFQLVTTISAPDDRKELKDRLSKKLGNTLEVVRKLSYRGSDLSGKVTFEQLTGEKLLYPITDTSLEKSVPGVSAAQLGDNDVAKYLGGVAIVLDNLSPPPTQDELESRLTRMRQQPDFAKAQYRDVKVIPVQYVAGETPGPGAHLARAVEVVSDPTLTYSAESGDDTWSRAVALTEWNLADQAFTTENAWQGETSFDAQVAGSARARAGIAIVISLALIVIYVWIRFGGLRYGIGAILSLCHDAIVALAATVLSGELVAHARPFADALLIGDFKINLTMIAAYLTVIGYSVNDTIVIFDRIRENRGRGGPGLTAKLVNDSINQCFGRTIWTTFTVFIVVLIMYIWGGEGVRGFSFAMLIGVITGAYSTLAIAAPALLNARDLGKSKPTTVLARVDDVLPAS